MKIKFVIPIISIILIILIAFVFVNKDNQNTAGNLSERDGTLYITKEQAVEDYNDGLESANASDTAAVGTSQDNADTSSEPALSETNDEIYYIDKKVPEEIRAIVIANRAELFNMATEPNTELFKSYLTPAYSEEEDDMVVSILQNNTPSDEAILEISREDAIKDVTFLMDYLKYFYGGYGYFGGDNVFHAIRDEIIEELGKMAEPVRTMSYRNLLCDKLKPIIIDSHFSIGASKLSSGIDYRYFLVNETYLFAKEGNIFITSDGKYEFISADGGQSKASLLPYMDKVGKFVWAIGLSSTTSLPIGVSLSLKNISTGETETFDVQLTETKQSPYSEGRVFYNLYERDGIKIATSRRLFLSVGEEWINGYELMGAGGEALQNEDILIMDLRQNSGGNSQYAFAWMQGFIGLDERAELGGELRTSRLTKTVVYTSPYTGFDSVEDFWENADIMRESNNVMGWNRVNFKFPGEYENKDTLVIVLIDSGTGSSGENFVKMLEQTENTIIIGTNTSGCLSFGNICEIELPYSKTKVVCGHNISLEPDGTSIEGIGIQPDIWAPPGEALERVLKFIANYNLN